MIEKNTGLESPVEHNIPKSQIIFGNVVYWLSIFSAIGALFVPIFILANPSNNVLNPNIVFDAIFAGATPAEIWELSVSGSFPGAHFYLDHITKADSWAMLFIVIGCGFGFFGLVPAVMYQVMKERDWFCAIFGTILAALIFFSIIGVLSVYG